jgi:hypothetical protein
MYSVFRNNRFELSTAPTEQALRLGNACMANRVAGFCLPGDGHAGTGLLSVDYSPRTLRGREKDFTTLTKHCRLAARPHCMSSFRKTVLAPINDRGRGSQILSARLTWNEYQD